MKRIALVVVAAALVPLGPPAQAVPCVDTTVPECTKPLRDKLVHLCFPPDVADPYGC
ncbi:MAG TPA: hypothetical protein VF519_12535 [Mycobacteriales bacterium]|jgi:hypothetical protein